MKNKNQVKSFVKVIMVLGWVLTLSTPASAQSLSPVAAGLLMQAKSGNLAPEVQIRVKEADLKAYGLKLGSYRLENGTILKVKPENRDGALCNPNKMITSTLTTITTSECTRYVAGNCAEQQTCRQDTAECMDQAGNTYRAMSEKYDCVSEVVTVQFSESGTSSGF